MSEQSNSGRIVTIIVVILVIIGASIGAWYLFSYKPEQEAKEQARLEQLAKEQEEQKRREQAAQRKDRYDQLIEEGDAAFALSNWESARSLYSEASTLLKNEQYPKDQLLLVNAELDKIAEIEARKAAGVIESVSSPTGRYYLIVSSSIDEDLAMDYAQKLAKEGKSVKLVKHNANELPFNGVSVGDYASWDQATSAAGSFTEYDSVWVLKY